MDLSGFHSLIEDDLNLRHQLANGAKDNPTAAHLTNTHAANKQRKASQRSPHPLPLLSSSLGSAASHSVSSSSGVSASASRGASATAAALSLSAALAQFDSKVAKEQRQRNQQQQNNKRKHQERNQRAARKRRLPAWMQLSASAHRDIDGPRWAQDELIQLSMIMQHQQPPAFEEDDSPSSFASVCRCRSSAGSKRRKATVDHQPDTASTCCCFTRMAYASSALHRTIADVEHQMSIWRSDPYSAPAFRTTANPAPAHAAMDPDKSPVAPLTSELIAARWSACGGDHDDSIPISALLDDSTTSTSIHGIHLTHLPRWSHELVHQLMSIVRDMRQTIARERDSEVAQSLDGAAACDASPPMDPPPSSDFSPLIWHRIGRALDPPQDGEMTRAMYLSVVDSSGYVVPNSISTQPPFYFPSQQQYESEVKFDYSEDESTSDQDTQQHTNRRATAASPSSQSASSCEEEVESDDSGDHQRRRRRSRKSSGAHARAYEAPDANEIIKQVRRSEKRREEKRGDGMGCA